MKKVMLIFGTRPEAIKMCPLVLELKRRPEFETVVCVTGQHREMLDQILQCFQVTPQYDLAIMRDKQTLFDVTVSILEKLRAILESEKPDVVLVHGDTSTAFVTALACFYLQIPVGHVEARAEDLQPVFPLPGGVQPPGGGSHRPVLLCAHGAEPAKPPQGGQARRAYLRNRKHGDRCAGHHRQKRLHPSGNRMGPRRRLILLTAHRRENLGEPMREMFRAIRRIVDETPDIKVIYPMHKNPAVREMARACFGGQERIHMIEPLDVLDFHNVMAHAYLIMTDSGGIQEEAPALGKPVLVMRDTTERPEGVVAGTLKLVGTDENTIYAAVRELLTDPAAYHEMEHAVNPYGDGHASRYIADILAREL